MEKKRVNQLTMGPKKTIRKKLEGESNDYSSLEPFDDDTPISSSLIIPVYNNGQIFQESIEKVSFNNCSILSLHICDICS